jgi:unsaturated chondroitin disaccharide hydrolase
MGIEAKISCGYLIVDGIDSATGLSLEIVSGRNTYISKMSDVSEHDKIRNETARDSNKRLGNRSHEAAAGIYEIWYPVVDIRLDDTITGVLRLTGAGTCTLNRMFTTDVADGAKEISVPAAVLEHWENILITRGNVECASFCLRKSLNNDCTHIAIKLLSDNWSGVARLRGVDGAVSWESGMLVHVGNRVLSGTGDSGALKDTLDYILRCQVKKPDSIFHNGLYLFYDHDAKTYRCPSWIWTWGTAIHLLLEANKIDGLRAEYASGQLLQAAREIGDASLRFQKTDNSSHPAHGLVTCRVDYDARLKGGYMEFLSPPDSLFLAGWGWMPLYAATGDERYLNATKLLVTETARILKQNTDIIEQDYMIPAEEWKDWILDEAGFGMKGIAALFAADPNLLWQRIGKEYIEQCLSIFEREDGLWDRMWTRSTATITKTEYHTRGAGWAMEGLLSAYELLRDTRYLEKAAKMADCLIQHQNTDGSWSFEFDKKPEAYGRSEKGTAYWANLLYRLNDFRPQPRYAQAAQRALDWCVANQYRGADCDGFGGVIGRTPHSGVVYRRFFDLSCTYTSAFFGEALILCMNRSEQADSAYVDDILGKVKTKIGAMLKRWTNKIPYMSKDGAYTADLRQSDIAWWTNGFWAGILWQMYHATGDRAYRAEAEKTEVWLDAAFQAYTDLHHDVGFMWLHSAVANYRETSSVASKARGLHAAGILAGRYNPAGRFIRAWNEDKPGWIIIDCMMNLPLLYWATEETGDPRFAWVAKEHADTAAQYLVKESGGCNHIAVLDEMDGRLIETKGGQGFENGSTWSRGTAWGLYGFALSYRHTKDTRYLHIAKRLADYFISRVSATGFVSLCDFDGPASPVIWDTSASAVAACGLLELAAWTKEGNFYKTAATKIIHALTQRFCDWDIERDGILSHSTVAYHDEGGRHVSLIYGDFFLIEAILRLNGRGMFAW